MKEKTYYEVIGVMENKRYDEIESQLSLGETCVKLIKQIEGREDVRGASELITVDGKKYDVQIFEWGRRPNNGIREI
ncbi:hypothetical protein O3602_09230 [Streptococcus sp. 27098_8_186]|uniref:hypothetical protein n=1 Tax=Streptococcus sp. 27098_8_186 TaxID=3003650 RepID=UPI00352F418E